MLFGGSTLIPLTGPMEMLRRERDRRTAPQLPYGQGEGMRSPQPCCVFSA